MPTTRRQAALEKTGVEVKPPSKSEKPKSSAKRGTKRNGRDVEQPGTRAEKKAKQDEAEDAGAAEDREKLGKSEKRPRDGPMRGM